MGNEGMGKWVMGRQGRVGRQGRKRVHLITSYLLLIT